MPKKIVERLPVFPPILQRLLEEVSNQDCSVRDVSRLIRADTKFSGEVLRLANSAIFETRFEVTSIFHAISVLGLDRLRALVVTVGLRDLMLGMAREECLLGCWRHNLACAFSSEWMAKSVSLDADTAYTAGLMHEIGRMVLLITDPEGYRVILQRSLNEGLDLVSLELEAYGIDHLGAASRMAEGWALPKALWGWKAEADVRELVERGCEVSNWLGFPFSASYRRQGPPPEVPASDAEWMRETIPHRINLFEQEFLN